MKIKKFNNFNSNRKHIKETLDINTDDPVSIQWVANINDKTTFNALKYLWEGMTESQKKERLNEMGYTLKTYDVVFENLMPNIQAGLIKGYHKIDLDNELN